MAVIYIEFMVKTVRLNEKLISLRKEKRMSQQDLAEALNVSRQAVSRWETGVATPSMENLMALSRVFGISVAEFINADEGADALKPEPEKEEGGGKAKKLISRWSLRVVLLILLVVTMIIVVISGMYLNHKRREAPVEQGTIKFEEMVEEKISNSEAVKSGAIS